jgi:putative ABC transport system permease protein
MRAIGIWEVTSGKTPGLGLAGSALRRPQPHLTLIVTGIILGVVASLALTRFIASQLSGVKATDPWTFVTVAVIILAVGLAACFFPARRATQVDPLVALRYE